MYTQIASKVTVDSSLFFEEIEATVDAWSLDELDRLSDLESIRSACARTDTPDN